MKDVSIGGVILLDRPELGADEKEEVSVLYCHNPSPNKSKSKSRVQVEFKSMFKSMPKSKV